MTRVYSEIPQSVILELERKGIQSSLSVATVGDLDLSLSIFSRRATESFRVLGPQECIFHVYDQDNEEVSQNLQHDARITIHLEVVSSAAKHITIYGRGVTFPRGSSGYLSLFPSPMAPWYPQAVVSIWVSRLSIAYAGPLAWDLPSISDTSLLQISSGRASNEGSTTIQSTPQRITQEQSQSTGIWGWPTLGDSCCAS